MFRTLSLCALRCAEAHAARRVARCGGVLVPTPTRRTRGGRPARSRRRWMDGRCTRARGMCRLGSLLPRFSRLSRCARARGCVLCVSSRRIHLQRPGASMLHPAVRRHGLGWRAVELRALGGTRAAELPLATARHGGEGGRAGLLPVRERAGPARRGQLRGGRVLTARLPPPHPYRPARRLPPHRHAAHAAHLAARPMPMRTAAHVVADPVEEAALRGAQLRLQEGLRRDAGLQAGCAGVAGWVRRGARSVSGQGRCSAASA